MKGVPNLHLTKAGNFTNKYGVRISAEEKKYINALIRSVNRKSKQIEKLLEPHTPPSYLKKKSKSTLTPTNYSPLQTTQMFTSRTKMYKKLDTLETQRRQLLGKNTQLPTAKKLNLNKTITKLSQKPAKLRIPKLSLKGYIKTHFTQYSLEKSKIYRENMITSIYKVDAITNKEELKGLIRGLTEEEFILFMTENPTLNIQYIYHDPANTKGRHLANIIRSYIGRKV